MYKIFHFIKYNNLALVLLVAALIIGASTFAAAPAGKELIGQKSTKIEGVDNKLLLEADLEKMDMDFKIGKIEEDEFYYFVTYTSIDLVKKNNAWVYEMQEKGKKISKKLDKDLGLYLADKFKQEREQLIAGLKIEKEKASKKGIEKRQEVVEYSGLIGKILNVSSKTFPGYEPIKKTDLPSPNMELPVVETETVSNDGSDDLTKIYNEYISTHNLVIMEQTLNDQLASTTTATTSVGDATTTNTTASSTELIIMPRISD